MKSEVPALLGAAAALLPSYGCCPFKCWESTLVNGAGELLLALAAGRALAGLADVWTLASKAASAAAGVASPSGGGTIGLFIASL